MTGTAAQVSWASEIKAGFEAAYTTMETEALASFDEMAGILDDEMIEAGKNDVRAEYAAGRAALFANDDAAYWIAKKDLSIATLISRGAK